MKTSTFATYPNPDLRFLSGLTLPAAGLERADIQLSGTHRRVPSGWHDIAFRPRRAEGRITLEFARPENCSFLRVEMVGFGGNLQDASLHYLPALDADTTRRMLKSQSMAFLACVRDCAGRLQQGLRRLEELGTLFGRSRIVVFENDSKDATRQMLRNWADGRGRQLVAEDGLDSALPLRTQRLGYARNRLLDTVRAESPDYFCVADLDGVLGDAPDEASFLSNFRQSGWDACFPICRSFYYDLWALRHPELCPADYSVAMNQLSGAFAAEDSIGFVVAPLQNFGFNRLRGWLPVDSAFGGMGVYRTAAFDDCRYFGLRDGQEVCEHVVFHEQARRLGARLYINPEFVIAGLPDSMKFRPS